MAFTIVAGLAACKTPTISTDEIGIGDLNLPSIGEEEALRLESNKSGTYFCVAGKALVPGDPGLTIHASDRVYILKPPPSLEIATVVAAKPGYFVFVDSTNFRKRNLQFDFFNRNKCRRNSKGRTCARSSLSKLSEHEKFCAGYP
ncbi:MAG: hypothetical protein AAFN27_18580 [Pseudomonadota bacterium]